jgi:SOS-response transcriptional repressor LexA
MPDADPPVYTITAAEFRMRCVAGWIEQYRKTHGHMPTTREIGAYIGLSSSGPVAFLLAEMRERGFLRWEPRKSRAAEVVVGPPLGSVDRLWTDPRLRGWRPTDNGDHQSAHRELTELEQVLRALAEGMTTAPEIAARTGLTRRDVNTLLSHMQAKGDAQRVSYGVYRIARTDVSA